LEKEALGIDIGGVITDRVSDNLSLSRFKEDYLKAECITGSFEAIGRLVAERFGGNVYLVSKAGHETRKRTSEWLAHHRFYEITGVKKENVRFCFLHPDKAPICKQLGITHFIDDRLQVLSYLGSVPHRYLFNPKDEEVDPFRKLLPKVRRVNSWEVLLRELLSESRR
jgi:hypothetical protein